MRYEQEFMEEVLSDNLDNEYQEDIKSDMFENYMADYV